MEMVAMNSVYDTKALNELADTGITCLALSKLSLTLANATFSVSG